MVNSAISVCAGPLPGSRLRDVSVAAGVSVHRDDVGRLHCRQFLDVALHGSDRGGKPSVSADPRRARGKRHR